MACPFSHSQQSLWSKLKKILTSFQPDGFGSKMDAANLQAILDTTVDSIITINEECIVRTLNKTAESMFGYKKEEILGKNINILMPEPFHTEHDSYVLNYLRTGHKKIIGIRREVVARRKDGSTFPIDLAVSEVIVDNQRLFTGIIRDVSGRAESEAMKIENLRIEVEMKAKNDFITMVSHELRTPLHAILGFTECLINEIDGPLNEAQKKSLLHSYHASEHLLQLVNGVLELSRIPFHQTEISKEECNIPEILNICMNTIAPLADQKNIRVEKRIDSPSITVKANPKHIQEILLNLLSNAVKFTDHGEIICTVTVDSQVIIKIQDTGIGMDPQNLTKIFIPFARINMEKNRSGEAIRPGMGLGLAITKQLVEIYKGTLTVTSQKGRGTTFTVSLPK